MQQQPQQQYVQYTQFTPTSATTALVLSILSFFCLGIFGSIPALIIASGAKRITNAQPGHPDSGTATAAKILSIINIGLTLVVMIFYVAIFLIAFLSVAAQQ